MSRSRYLTAAVLVAAALAVAAVAVRQQTPVNDPDARAAYAEYLVAVDARGQAAAQARRARELDGGEPVAREADRVGREAGESADRLRATWGERWRRLGLVAK